MKAVINVGKTIHGREVKHVHGGTDKYSVLGADLELEAAAGTSDSTDPHYIMPIMGNLIGAALTKTENYLAGVYGKYSVTGAKSTVRPTGGTVGEAAGRCDGAVVAVLGSHEDATEARPGAMFKAFNDNNNHAEGAGTAKADYGMDLFDDHQSKLKYTKADIRMSYEVCVLSGAGAPTNGVAGTGAAFAEIGSIYCDRTNGKAYINGGTKASPTWKLITSAA